MKSKEELDALKEEVNNVNEKLKELTPEELEQVNGGAKETILLKGTIRRSGVTAGSKCN